MTEQTPPGQPPNTLDYKAPGPAGPAGRKRRVRLLLIGLAAGSIVSAVIWIFGWDRLVQHGSGTALFLVPGVKLLIGLALLFVRGWRSLGVGVLLSIAVGFLIFFGSCFAQFKM